MMCIACQQDFMWLAYLESRGAAGADKPARTLGPFAATAENPTAEGVGAPVEENRLAGDDPLAGAADLQFLPTKSE